MGSRPLGTPLTLAAQTWPTPTSCDANGAGSRSLPTNKAHAGTSLTDATERAPAWATPTSSAATRGAAARGANAGGAPPLGEQAERGLCPGLPVPPIATPGEPSSPPTPPSPPLRLSPRFVEWLMGYPINWTNEPPDGYDASDSAPSATP